MPIRLSINRDPRCRVDTKLSFGPFKTGPFEPTLGSQNEPQATEEKEPGIRQLLTDYGLFAVAFHFSVWVSCITVVYTLLTLGMDEKISALFSTDDLSVFGFDLKAAGSVGELGLTMALVEAVGPLRLGLTLAATPSISRYARQFEWVQETEMSILNFFSNLMARFGLES
eukprot:CAMPEP_0185775528 /NCGR_PEP_ID=MMETSP1174-20130828/82367_1 /TAXON_ID=35687 /ORGANISM="Dictyocha speculum, Strain CCMP1381" /LENGTH=169 /DNA_ID=CAMNT_0028463143 /DNA_START=116 /DNA_END=625 /DNA_ORIENTATION=+